MEYRIEEVLRSDDDHTLSQMKSVSFDTFLATMVDKPETFATAGEFQDILTCVQQRNPLTPDEEEFGLQRVFDVKGGEIVVFSRGVAGSLFIDLARQSDNPEKFVRSALTLFPKLRCNRDVHNWVWQTDNGLEGRFYTSGEQYYCVRTWQIEFDSSAKRRSRRPNYRRPKRFRLSDGQMIGLLKPANWAMATCISNKLDLVPRYDSWRFESAMSSSSGADGVVSNFDWLLGQFIKHVDRHYRGYTWWMDLLVRAMADFDRVRKFWDGHDNLLQWLQDEIACRRAAPIRRIVAKYKRLLARHDPKDYSGQQTLVREFWDELRSKFKHKPSPSELQCGWRAEDSGSGFDLGKFKTKANEEEGQNDGPSQEDEEGPTQEAEAAAGVAVTAEA